MQFLSVNPEDYLPPGERQHSQMVLPNLATTSSSTMELRSCSTLPQLRASSSNGDIYRLGKSNASLYSSIASSLHRSSENLCFGKVKKKKHLHNLLFDGDSSIYRPRCNAEPFQRKMDVSNLTPSIRQNASIISLSPFSKRNKHEKQPTINLSSLVEETVKIASISMGAKDNGNRLSDVRKDSIDDDYTYDQNYKTSRLLKQSAFPLGPSRAAVAARSGATSINSSLKSISSNIGTTAKHEQTLSTAAAASNIAAAAATPTDKEKKRKEVSSSRVKKFHRHFSQVSKDEKLINYFSCALVSDILLQGHLYITDQHFAFYSNVFGYVTKVVIPTSSVTKISKEKTAKIIPNAVGVATADERHVFGSFISREAAFRLMCSVCPPLAPIEILPKISSDILEYSEELSIEDDSSCSISGNESPPQSTNVTNSDQVLLRRNIAGSNLSIATNNDNGKLLRHSDIHNHVKSFNTSMMQHQSMQQRASAPPTAHCNKSNSNENINNNSPQISNTCSNKYKSDSVKSSLTTLSHMPASTGANTNSQVTETNITMIIAGTASSTSASSTPSPSSVSSTTSLPTTVLNTPKIATQVAATSFKTPPDDAIFKLKFPKELHVVYVGVLLSIILALFSVFLLYRILDIEAKANLYSGPPIINWGLVNDDDIFTEALRWQKELQAKSTEEAQIILKTNLEQIAKVRRSLETLSNLIGDRSTMADMTTTASAETYKCDDGD